MYVFYLKKNVGYIFVYMIGNLHPYICSTGCTVQTQVPGPSLTVPRFPFYHQTNQFFFFLHSCTSPSIDISHAEEEGEKKKEEYNQEKKKKTIYVARSNPFYPILGILGFFFF